MKVYELDQPDAEHNQLSYLLSRVQQTIDQIVMNKKTFVLVQFAFTFEYFVWFSVTGKQGAKPPQFSHMKNKLPQNLTQKFNDSITYKDLSNTITELKNLRKPIAHPTSMDHTQITEEEFRELLDQYYKESQNCTEYLEPLVEFMINYIKDANGGNFVLR